MLKVKKLDSRAKLPEVAHVGDLGYDLFALEDTVLKFGVVTKVRTGVSVQAFNKPQNIPQAVGYSPLTPLGLLIRDCSSMAAKGIVTSGGVIDAGYRGEISVLMTNWNKHVKTIYPGGNLSNPLDYNIGPGKIVEVDDPRACKFVPEYHIKAGDKIAQMIPMPVLTGEVVEVEELGESVRGEKGFGSSGS